MPTTTRAPDLKWLLQNARTINIRNLVMTPNSGSQMIDAGIELLDDDRGSKECILRGSSILDTCNPSWTFSGLVSANSLLDILGTKVLRLRITGKASGTPSSPTSSSSTVFEEVIDLSKLVRLKIATTGNLTAAPLFPVNFLFLNIDDAFYTSETMARRLNPKPYANAVYTGKFFEVEEDIDEDDAHSDDNDDGDSSRTKASTASSAAAAAAAGSAQLENFRADVKHAWEKSSHLDKGNQQLSETTTLRLLQEQLEAEENAARIEEELEQRELQVLDAIKSEIMGSASVCTKLVENVRNAQETLDLKQKSLLKTKFLLEARQIKLLSELQTIYPIEQLENGEHAIRGLELPADLNSKDDELVAAALCNTVHLMLLASKYLEVPMRYQILFLGSRSMIRDPLQGSAGTLPLFRRNVEKERFDRAIVWLKKDIEQLLLSRGYTYEPHKDILYNLHQLFQCEMCPKLAL